MKATHNYWDVKRRHVFRQGAVAICDQLPHARITCGQTKQFLLYVPTEIVTVSERFKSPLRKRHVVHLQGCLNAAKRLLLYVTPNSVTCSKKFIVR